MALASDRQLVISLVGDQHAVELMHQSTASSSVETLAPGDVKASVLGIVEAYLQAVPKHGEDPTYRSLQM
ncbi:MAG: hypothetical protein JOZ81_05750 [Chloroflexi bacterium]|nr:hypothetical protein [Chloroflexota bacterium]